MYIKKWQIKGMGGDNERDKKVKRVQKSVGSEVAERGQKQKDAEENSMHGGEERDRWQIEGPTDQEK